MTTQGALHLYGSSKEETEKWIDCLRKVIAKSSGLTSDPLLAPAKKIETDTYDIHFSTKQKLNIVLERAAEWAVVKHVRSAKGETPASPSTAVTEGSALVAVRAAQGCEGGQLQRLISRSLSTRFG